MSTHDLPEQSPADTGLSDEQVLVIALDTIASEEGSRAISEDIIRAVERAMGGAYISSEGKQAVQTTLERGIDLGYVYADQERSVWLITPEGREYRQHISTDREQTESLGETKDDLIITSPVNPELIRVNNDRMTVFQVMRKLKFNEIVLDPEFQRNIVWDRVRQSRLIESILLHIPLPAFYFDQSIGDKRWYVVDGLQRLSALKLFYNNKDPKKQLRLAGLQYLKELEGKTFNDLPRNLQRTIEDETYLTLYIIQPDTPQDVKFLIFNRVNTGGLTLTAQEIRHALYQGAATRLLRDLAATEEFLRATTRSISPLRMDDRECVLRFLAFRLFDYQDFGRPDREDSPANLEMLLNRTMSDLNDMSTVTLDQHQQTFRESMTKAREVFGSKAFRKMYSHDDPKRYPISKPLFEVWSVLFVGYSLEALVGRKQAVMDAFIDLMNRDRDFERAISLGTGSRTTILYRFGRIQQLLQEVVG